LSGSILLFLSISFQGFTLISFIPASFCPITHFSS
jgi:hypothetical protein